MPEESRKLVKGFKQGSNMIRFVVFENTVLKEESGCSSTMQGDQLGNVGETPSFHPGDGKVFSYKA